VLDGRNCSLSASQKLAAMSLTNMFENGRFDFEYGKDWLLRSAADLQHLQVVSPTSLLAVQIIARTSRTGVELQLASLGLLQQMVRALVPYFAGVFNSLLAAAPHHHRSS